MDVQGRNRLVAKAAVVVALAGMALVTQSSCLAQGSRDALFGDDEDSPKAKASVTNSTSPAKSETGPGGPAFKGFVQLEAARTTEDPRHWSKLRTRGEFEDALTAAKERDGQFVLLDVRLDKLDFSPALKRLGQGLNKAATATA